MSAREAEQRGGVGLALDAFPVVVGLIGRVAEVGECRQRRGSLERFVAAALGVLAADQGPERRVTGAG